jgi:ankyrin repeat protein
VVRLLLDYNNEGVTALHWAAGNGHEMILRLLLEEGADINAKDNFGRTALYWVAENRHEAIVRLLLNHKADVNVKDNLGRTALYPAA